MSLQLSLIVPALDQAGVIAAMLGAPASLRERGHEPAPISQRLWETCGVWPTVWLNRRLLWRCWRGVPVDELARVHR